MAYVAQRRCKLSGVVYERGDIVPDKVINGHVQRLRLVSTVPDDMLKAGSGKGSDAKVLAAAQADAEAAHARADAAEAALAEALAAKDESSPDEGSATPPAEVPAPKGGDEPEAFDPGKHTVEEVIGFVTEHPEALDDLLVAERDGKNRVSLIAALEGHTE